MTRRLTAALTLALLIPACSDDKEEEETAPHSEYTIAVLTSRCF
jgi:hypothetical protein